jgi:hypothetical protein
VDQTGKRPTLDSPNLMKGNEMEQQQVDYKDSFEGVVADLTALSMHIIQMIDAIDERAAKTADEFTKGMLAAQKRVFITQSIAVSSLLLGHRDAVVSLREGDRRTYTSQLMDELEKEVAHNLKSIEAAVR